MADVTEVDEIVASIKRTAMDAEYARRLRVVIGDTLPPDDAPPFTARPIVTSSATVAARAAARQGFDAGRWGAATDCPYLADQSGPGRFLRRAWFAGYAAGRKVTPRPERRPFAQRPVTFAT